MLAAPPGAAFDWLDDPRHLGGHMERPSWRTAGGWMVYRLDERNGREVGSIIRLEGRILGRRLSLEEVVSVREPPRQKVWETIGTPAVIVVGAYRMGFELEASAGGSALRMLIDFEPSPRWPGWIGRALARWYAHWCVKRMAVDAAARFSAVPAAEPRTSST